MMKISKPVDPHSGVKGGRIDPKELNFIIDYDITYRMGRDGQEGE